MLTTVGIFTGAEGLADAAGALKPSKPAPEAVTNVRVDATHQEAA